MQREIAPPMLLVNRPTARQPHIQRAGQQTGAPGLRTEADKVEEVRRKRAAEIDTLSDGDGGERDADERPHHNEKRADRDLADGGLGSFFVCTQMHSTSSE